MVKFVVLTLAPRSLDRDQVDALASLAPGLSNLRINCCAQSSMASLAALTSVTRLTLDRVPAASVRSHALPPRLGELRLVDLELGSHALFTSDLAGLVDLSGLSTLTHLIIEADDEPHAAAPPLEMISLPPSLAAFAFAGPLNEYSDVSGLLRLCHTLQHLEMPCASSWAHKLGALTALTHLSLCIQDARPLLEGQDIEITQLAGAIHKLRGLEHLALEHTRQARHGLCHVCVEECMAAAAGLPHLTSVSLANVTLAPTAAGWLAGATGLTRLDLRGSNLCDFGANLLLARLPRLRELILESEPNVTEAILPLVALRSSLQVAAQDCRAFGPHGADFAGAIGPRLSWG